MQSSEHEAQIGFGLRTALFLLRYGYGDLTFRKCPGLGRAICVGHCGWWTHGWWVISPSHILPAPAT